VFTIDLKHHNPAEGAVTVAVQAVVWDDLEHDFLLSGWQSISFTYQARPDDPPQINSLALTNDTGDPTDNTTIEPNVVGVAVRSDNSGDALLIQYDLTGDDTPEGTISTTDETGQFTINLKAHQIAEGSVIVRARAGDWDAASGEYLYGNWQQLAFTYQMPANILPQITGLYLVNDTAPQGDGITTDAQVAGAVVHDDGTIDNLPVQFDYNGDGLVDGFINSSDDQTGAFTINLNPEPLGNGAITIKARAGELNDSGHYEYGDWQSFTFVYDGAVDVSPPNVTNLHLIEDTNIAEDLITTKPNIAGKVTVDSGSVVAMPVEYDLQPDGEVDGVVYADVSGSGEFFINLEDHVHVQGPVDLKVRAGVLDRNAGTYVYGDWVTFSFQFQFDPNEVMDEPRPTDYSNDARYDFQ
ncbi:MAG: hypothetical protein HYV60_11205, partial [Planctomycetia bacterium]|nr:hypothetical protein [Planctomycetia bacterium]